jgi:sRNA-binding regulator protein Hfq
MGIDDAALTERIGLSLDALNHATARTAISVLRKEMEESGTWQPRVGEGPDQEGEYLAKLRDRRTLLDVRLISGEQLSGTVEDFTPYVIQLRDTESGAHVSVRKLAIAYYQTRGPVDDAE